VGVLYVKRWLQGRCSCRRTLQERVRGNPARFRRFSCAGEPVSYADYDDSTACGGSDTSFEVCMNRFATQEETAEPCGSPDPLLAKVPSGNCQRRLGHPSHTATPTGHRCAPLSALTMRSHRTLSKNLRHSRSNDPFFSAPFPAALQRLQRPTGAADTPRSRRGTPVHAFPQ